MKTVSESYARVRKHKMKIGIDGETIEIRENTTNTAITSWKLLFFSIFLPQGYPHSVTGDYLEYQMWDTIQAFASSITGALATEAILKGAGVGNE
ncbi:unnamed protein product, partial [Mesorhabditis belari]|uniref:Protein root UVB sensitive/RUS domain-containing protein n=1 Tax=Mesorhabditis belari TaxID=2138241 RepID=A0AAF3EHF0_9BILA